MSSTQKWWFVVVAAVGFVLLTGGRASAETANVYLDSVGSGTVLAGVYTSPYGAVFTPGSTSAGAGTSVPAICDDFYDNSYIDEDWNTNVTTLSSLTSYDLTSGPDTTVKWGQSGSVAVNDTAYGGTLDTTLTQVQAYDAAALLSISILGSTPAGDQQQQDLSYALWALFDTSQSLTQLSGNPTDKTNAINDLNTAVQEVISGEVGTTPLSAYLSNYNVTIYSYSGVDVGGTTSPTTCPSGPCDPPPQEMITVTSMSEPPSLGVFAVYFLLGGGCLLFFGRRGILKADS
jgi:hypothetical protein